jgi:hypothetical protein
VLKSGSILPRIIVLFVVALAALVHAQSSPRIIRNPRNLSSEARLTMIQEYEAGRLPDDLGSNEKRDSGPERKR